MNLTRKYLSKFLPAFTQRPNHQPKKAAERNRPRAHLPVQPSQTIPETKESILPAPKPLDTPPNPVEMLDSITRFLRQYIICEDYQYTLLALWIVHTWCFRHFPTAVYLEIRSIDSESAKTLCLRLLATLCNSPWIATGAHWRSVIDNLLTSDRRVMPGKPLGSASLRTILLDDCHHTFAPSERQPVLALLNSGSQAACTYIDGLARYSAFGPKAFASNTRLPRSLDSRCLPIVLRRKRPADVIARFTPDAAASAAVLLRSLESWSAANSAALAKVACQTPARFPAGMTARKQDCAEPLLHIADRIGGSWPERARAAIVAGLRLANDSMAIELLADIRGIFYLKEDPAYLSTKDLLAALINVDHRPWSAWSTCSGRRLGPLLHPFGGSSRSLHKGSSPSFKGYLRETFLDAWDRYLPPIPADWPETRARMKKDAEAAAAEAPPPNSSTLGPER